MFRCLGVWVLGFRVQCFGFGMKVVLDESVVDEMVLAKVFSDESVG